MRNVYLSFLGTNKYLKCIYTHPELSEQKPSRYVQTATLRLFDAARDAEACNANVAYFFLTEEAKRLNWKKSGCNDPDDPSQPCEGLESCIDNLGLRLNVEVKDIPRGENETELWEIFERVYGVIQKGDKITFDVTHAFRSIPMFALVILTYAKTLKEASIEKIYYGAFETLGTFQEAKSKPLEERLAPIFDLTSFVYLLDWTVAVDRFFKTGDSSSIARLARDKALPILKSTKGQDQNAQELRRIADRLEELGGSLSTARLTKIGTVARLLAEKLDTFKSVDLVKPFEPLLSRLKDKISSFQEEDPVRDGIHAAKWCLEHNLVQQGYTILQETVLTHLLQKARCGLPPHKREIREVAGQAVKIYREKLNKEQWRSPAKDHPDLTDSLLECIKCVNRTQDLVSLMDKLSARRNDLNHAGTTEGASEDWKAFKKDLESLIRDVEQAISG